jgi:hypothetical protein
MECRLRVYADGKPKHETIKVSNLMSTQLLVKGVALKKVM